MKSQKLALESTEKKTRQRREVLRVLQKAYGPLSSFEIHDLARQNLPNIGLTTIYRTLRIMQREGNVRSVVLPDGVMRFEATRLGQHHFQCRVCQQILDAPQQTHRSVESVEAQRRFRHRRSQHDLLRLLPDLQKGSFCLGKFGD